MASDKSVREQLGVELPEREPPEAIEVQQPEPPEAQESQRPEWLPEKFKTEAEFASSYTNLEDELRRRAEAERAKDEQISQLMGVVENFQTPQPQPQQQNEYAEQLMSAYEADPIGTMVFLAQQSAQQAVAQYQQQQAPQYQQQQVVAGELMATSAERVLESKYPDWQEYGPRVGALLERNPNLIGGDVLTSLDRTTEVLESVYKQVKFDDLQTQLETHNGDQTRMKQQAQTMSGAAGRPGQPSAESQQIDRIIAAAKNSSYSAFRNG